MINLLPVHPRWLIIPLSLHALGQFAISKFASRIQYLGNNCTQLDTNISYGPYFSYPT
jgi:hypothetical protein